MKEQEIRELVKPLLDKYCVGEIKELIELPNKYLIGKMEDGRELDAIIIVVGENVIGFGLGIKGDLVMVTQDPQRYAKKIVKDYEEKVLSKLISKA